MDLIAFESLENIPGVQGKISNAELEQDISCHSLGDVGVPQHWWCRHAVPMGR